MVLSLLGAKVHGNESSSYPQANTPRHNLASEGSYLYLVKRWDFVWMFWCIIRLAHIGELLCIMSLFVRFLRSLVPLTVCAVVCQDLKTFREESQVPVLRPELWSSSHTSERRCKQEEIDVPPLLVSFRLPSCNLANELYHKTSCAVVCWMLCTRTGTSRGCRVDMYKKTRVILRSVYRTFSFVDVYCSSLHRRRLSYQN